VRLWKKGGEEKEGRGGDGRESTEKKGVGIKWGREWRRAREGRGGARKERRERGRTGGGTKRGRGRRWL